MTVRGLFITVEGGEGVGKSTNMAYLEQQLRDQGVDLLITREPGGTELGEQLREILLQPRSEAVDPVAELLLIFAARSQHLKESIEPALAAGRWVLCDRFTDATYAYQSSGRGLDSSVIRQLESLVQGHLRPDYTVLLDAPVEVGMARASDRGPSDRFEQEAMEFFQRVRDAYLQLAETSSGRYRIIDASVALAQVQVQLRRLCQELVVCWHARREVE